MTAPSLNITDRMPDDTILGTNISTAANTGEALALAGLDWGLVDTPADDLTIMGPEGVTIGSMPDRRLISRSDNGVILDVVGARYTPIENADAFALADQAKTLGAQFANAGEVDHGRTTFMTMTIPEATGYVGGSDPVDFGFYIRTGVGQAATYSVSARRRVCTNGMSVGFSGAKTHSWAIRHTRSADENLILARAAVRDAMAYAKEFVAHAEAMVNTPMSSSEFGSFLDTFAPKPDEAKKAATTRWETRRAELRELFNGADTQEDIRGTRWAAFNAVTEHLDWYTSTKGDNPTEARALRQFNGTAETHRQRAFNLLQPA